MKSHSIFPSLLSLGVALSPTACGSTDPCAGVSGTCVALTVTSSTLMELDRLQIEVSGVATGSKTSNFGSKRALPVSLAIQLNDSIPSGKLGLLLSGELAGSRIGTGTASVDIVAGQHVATMAEIKPAASNPDGADLSMNSPDMVTPVNGPDMATTVPHGDPPAAPTLVSACPANAQVTVGFQTIPGADSYNVYYGTSANVSKSNGTKVAGVASPAAIANLSNGTPYYFVVTAVGSGGESTESAATQPVTPDAAVHDALFLLQSGAVQVFDCYSTMGTTPQPTRSFTNSNLSGTAGGIAVDATNAEIYTVVSSRNAIDVWSDATRISGAKGPSRSLVGVATGLNQPGSLQVDIGRGRIYVSAASGLRVFANSSTLGDVAPLASDSTKCTAGDVGLNLASDTLYCKTPNSQFPSLNYIHVFMNASTLTGSPLIESPNHKGTSNIGPALTLDASKDALFIADVYNSTAFMTYYVRIGDQTGPPGWSPSGQLRDLEGMGNSVTTLFATNDILFTAGRATSSGAPVDFRQWNKASSLTKDSTPSRTGTTVPMVGNSIYYVP